MSQLTDQIDSIIEQVDGLIAIAKENRTQDVRAFADATMETVRALHTARGLAARIKPGLLSKGVQALITEQEDIARDMILKAISGELSAAEREGMDDEQRRHFVAGMLAIVAGINQGSIDPEHAAQRLEDGAKWLRQLAMADTKAEEPPAKSTKLRPSIAEVREVFEHWREITERPTSKLGRVHKDSIRACLARGYTVEQMKHVTIWAVQDSWYSGANPQGERYDWPINMFCEKNFEKNLEKSEWAETQAPIVDLDDAREIRRLEQASEQAMKRMDYDEYNRLQEKLRARLDAG